MSDPLDQILGKLKAAGVEEASDRDGVALVLNDIFEKYEQHRLLLSRDSMSTAPELLRAVRKVREHVEAVVDLCHADMGLLQWLEEYAAEASEPRPKFGASFMNPMIACFRAATTMEAKFKEAVERNEPLILTTPGGQQIEHRRRTRTQSRDEVLIPSLVGMLHLAGLRLRDGDEWNLEALDAACDIVTIILQSQNVPVPESGNPERGEEHQGRLRRAVKDAYAQIVPALTATAQQRTP